MPINSFRLLVVAKGSTQTVRVNDWDELAPCRLLHMFKSKLMVEQDKKIQWASHLCRIIYLALIFYVFFFDVFFGSSARSCVMSHLTQTKNHNNFVKIRVATKSSFLWMIKKCVTPPRPVWFRLTRVICVMNLTKIAAINFPFIIAPLSEKCARIQPLKVDCENHHRQRFFDDVWPHDGAESEKNFCGFVENYATGACRNLRIESSDDDLWNFHKEWHLNLKFHVFRSIIYRLV